MSNVMINLISEQTVPVLQFIKEFPPMDKYIFVTTDEMEEKKKTDSLINALNLSENQFKKILVNGESLKDTEKKLDDFYQNEINDDDKIYINVTPGTKLMAMATYKVFSRYENVKIFYIPFKLKVLKQIHPERKQNDKNLSYQIKLDEYLTIYGIKIESKRTPLYDFETSKKCFDLYLKGELTNILDRLRDLRNSNKNMRKN